MTKYVEHRLGEVLAETVNHKGLPGPGRGHKTGNTMLPVSDGEIPKEITKMQSSRSQQLAEIPRRVKHHVRQPDDCLGHDS
jgi:hypothetical protein